MDIHDYSPSPTARRFQSGTPPVPSIYAGVAGIELMQEIGIAETREHVLGLTERLIAGVDELGGRVVTPREPERRGALVCIRSTDAPALVRALGEDGIVTSARDGNLRVSPHAYNDEPRTSTRCSPRSPATATCSRRDAETCARARVALEPQVACSRVKSDTQDRRRSTRRSTSSRRSTARARSREARRSSA